MQMETVTSMSKKRDDLWMFWPDQVQVQVQLVWSRDEAFLSFVFFAESALSVRRPSVCD